MTDDDLHPIFQNILKPYTEMRKPLTSERGERILKFEKELKLANKKFLSFPGNLYVLPESNIIVTFDSPVNRAQAVTIKGWVQSKFQLKELLTMKDVMKFLLQL